LLALQWLRQLGQQLHWLWSAAQLLAAQVLAAVRCLLVELLLVLPVAALLLWVAPAAGRAAWCRTASSTWPH
jgi:hypothetical protein